jgi:hypothetical protein
LLREKVRAAAILPPAGALLASGQREDALSLRLVPVAIGRKTQAMPAVTPHAQVHLAAMVVEPKDRAA